MKKRILLISLALVLTLSFCSCDYLDELKAMQFTWADENQDVLLSRDGTKYELLSYTGGVYPTEEQYTTGYVVDPEVPILLSSSFGVPIYCYENGIVELDPSDDYFGIMYCRSDLISTVEAFIKGSDGVLCYYYPNYELYRYEVRKLTEQEQALIDNILTNGARTKVLWDQHTFDISVDLYRVSDDLGLEVFELCIEIKDDQYFLTVYEEDTATVCVIPSDKYEIFDTILAEYTSSPTYSES